MAISGDIEKLERRWMENPTGLMFAPLAEAHRKAGDPARALEILEQGLAQHPEYVPALIVKGRCGLDGDALPEAEGAFRQALERDPVNAIALRGIAEVFERTGRVEAAVEKLEFLLEVDRGDGEARAALTRLRTAPPRVSEPPAFVAPVDAAPALPDPVAEAPAAPLPEAPAEPESPAVPPDQWAQWMPGGIESAPPPETAEQEVAGLVTNDSEGPFPEYAAPVDEALAPEFTAVAPELDVELGEPEPADPAPAADQPAGWSSWASWSAPAQAVENPAADLEPVAPEPEVLPEPVQDAPPAVDPVAELEVEPVEVADPTEGDADAPLDVELVAWAPASEAEEVVDSVAGLEEEAPIEEAPEPMESVPQGSIMDPAAGDQVTAWSPASVEAAEPTEAAPSAESGSWELEALEPDPVTAQAEPPVSDTEEVVPVEALAPEPEPEPEPASASASDVIVTESMAELFLRQGHRDLALAVYRQLVSQPGHEHLAEVVAGLEVEARAAAPEPISEPVESPAPEPEPRRQYAAEFTGGVPVAVFLREVLDAPPPGGQGNVLPPATQRGPEGEPTRASDRPLSLSDVFGEEGPGVAPAVSAESPPAEAMEPSASAEAPAEPPEPSYDEFFAPAAVEEDAGAAGTAGEEEDLAQFNQWLRGLKR